MSHPDPTPMTMEAVQAALRELNDRWAGFAIRDESIINAEIRADLRAKYGWEIDDILWSDGEYGRKCEIKLSIQPQEIVIEVVKEPIE
jgi:hypothetical protein